MTLFSFLGDADLERLASDAEAAARRILKDSMRQPSRSHPPPPHSVDPPTNSESTRSTKSSRGCQTKLTTRSVRSAAGCGVDVGVQHQAW